MMRTLFAGVWALALLATCSMAAADPNHGHGGGGARPAAHGGGAARSGFSGSRGSVGRPGFSHGSSAHRPTAHGAAFHHTPARAIHIRVSTHHLSHRTPVAHHVVRHGTNRGVHVVARRPVAVSHLRRNFRSPRRYHFGAYRHPGGWYAHRWTYGQRLPRGWYSHDYWITDWALFGLIAPPDDYQWVRVGDDAVLIDADTGEIVQVDYDVFY